MISILWAKLFTFAREKCRLIIEYILIAVLITTAALTLNLWLGKLKVESKLSAVTVELGEVKNKIVVLESVNKVQQQTIDDLKNLRAKDSKIVAELISGFDEIASNTSGRASSIETLERKDETVSNYLNTVIPPNLIDWLCKSKTCGNNSSDKN